MCRNVSYQTEFHAVYRRRMFNFNLEANHSSQINEPLVKFVIINDVQMLLHAVTPTWCVRFWWWAIFTLRTSGTSLRIFTCDSVNGQHVVGGISRFHLQRPNTIRQLQQIISRLIFHSASAAAIPCFPTTIPQYPSVRQKIGKGSVRNGAVNKEKLPNNTKYATLPSKCRRYLYPAVGNLRALSTASFGFRVTKIV
jgi:hypothetical protein